MLDAMQKEGQSIKQDRLNKKEYLRALHAKLLEEANEFDPTDKEVVEEFADLLEVIEHLATELNISMTKVLKAKRDKLQKRGGYSKKIFIETVTLRDDDPWVEYFVDHQDKYPEVVQ